MAAVVKTLVGVVDASPQLSCIRFQINDRRVGRLASLTPRLATDHGRYGVVVL